MDKNMLAVTGINDASNRLLRDFIKSLPKDSRKVYDSIGYVGSLEESLRHSEQENKRKFAIFRAPSFENLVTDYFSGNPDSTLIEIPDCLILKVMFKEKCSEGKTGAENIVTQKGAIEQMIDRYRNTATSNMGPFFFNSLEHSEELKKAFTKRIWFKPWELAIVPTLVLVGLETADQKYLIRTTGAEGPYSGTTKTH